MNRTRKKKLRRRARRAAVRRDRAVQMEAFERMCAAQYGVEYPAIGAQHDASESFKQYAHTVRFRSSLGWASEAHAGTLSKLAAYDGYGATTGLDRHALQVGSR